MRTYKEVDLTGDAAIDIDLEDVLDFIDQAKPHELDRIKDTLPSASANTLFNVKTLYDKLKCDLFVKAFNKYSLQELETKLGNL